MGRTSKPLTILVSDELADSEPIKELVRKGHYVGPFSQYPFGDDYGNMYTLADFDLILAPNAQLMTSAHLPYLDEAVKRARRVKYPSKKGVGSR